MSSKHCNYLPWVFVRPPAALTCVTVVLYFTTFFPMFVYQKIIAMPNDKRRKKSGKISALAQVPSHINTHLTNVIDENVQSSSKFVHNSVVVGTWMAKQPFFGSKQWIIFSFSCFLYALHGVVRRRWTYIVVGVRHKNML